VIFKSVKSPFLYALNRSVDHHTCVRARYQCDDVSLDRTYSSICGGQARRGCELSMLIFGRISLNSDMTPSAKA
jgi:hypothetical protein